VAALDPALLPLKRYADFTGRSTRTELVSFLFLIAIVSFTLVFAASVIHAALGLVIRVLLALALILPWWAVVVRRFHDQGRSGWWVLAPLLLGGGATLTPDNFSAWAVLQLLAAIAVWTLLLWKPDESENRYGPNPRLEESLTDR